MNEYPDFHGDMPITSAFEAICPKDCKCIKCTQEVKCPCGGNCSCSK